MKKIELLAPAKDLHKAKIAVLYGADAVFIGGKQYSLRSRASNFTEEDMLEAVQFAHEHGVKLYVTLNIVFHDEDIVGVIEYLQRLEAMKVDAVIIESMALVQLGKKFAPGLEYHISTQLSSLNASAANTLHSLGADRVVLGRETSMDDIEAIARQTDVELEVFIHGGMCANVSGRCTLSNHMTLRDANRGGCAQSCRWHYHLYAEDKKTELSEEGELFTMGSKDLTAPVYLERMVKAGISSLKIEGRMKSDYYIATVVKTYRMMLDEIAEKGTLSNERVAYYEKELDKAENRPSECGFLDGKMNVRKQLYHEGRSVRHDYVAYVMGYDFEKQKAILSTRNPFSVGDELEIFGPNIHNYRFILEEMEDEEGQELRENKFPMKTVRIRTPFPIAERDMIRKVMA